ncbi:hypothetical protein ES705_29992 [subsurface metagenome]
MKKIIILLFLSMLLSCVKAGVPPIADSQKAETIKKESPFKEGASSNNGVIPEYQVVKIENVSFTSVKRYNVRVRVDSVLVIK